MWKRVGSILRFCFDKKGALCLDSTCFATGNNIDYICCVLNSPMGHYLLKDAPKTGTGDLLISVQAVEPVKIPVINESDSNYYRIAVAELLSSHNETLATELNNRIFNLYRLSPDERDYITNNFA